VEIVDACSGATVRMLERTGQYFVGPNNRELLISSSDSSYFIIQESHKVSIPKLTFALLDAAFSPDTVCITESTGPVRCIDCVSGAELWSHAPPADSHALRLHYNDRDGAFYGVVWHYQRGEFHYLVRFDARTGQTTRLCDLNEGVETFSAATQQLVSSTGEVFDLSTGDVVGELAFPR
jgi:hypothetical protein